jgi:hypothetical protein
MDRPDLTTQGFRSTFKDWAGEETDFPNELSEMALAHKVGSKVEQAYRRKDGLQKRRALTDAWADYLTRLPAIATVIPMQSARSSLPVLVVTTSSLRIALTSSWLTAALASALASGQA